MKTEKFTVTGMTCAACQANVSKKVSSLNGVKDVDVNLLSGKMKVEYDEGLLNTSDIIGAVSSIGYAAEISGKSEKNKGTLSDEWKVRREKEIQNEKQMKARLISSAVILIPLMYIAMSGMLSLPVPKILEIKAYPAVNAFTQFLLCIPVLIINKNFFITGFKALFKKAPNMNSLVAVGSSASFLYGVFALYRMIFALSTGNSEILHKYSHSLYFESSAMILTLVSVGKFLETKSKAKTSFVLEKLVKLSPDTARIERNGQEITVKTEDIKVGDTVLVRAGETIPVDGTVISGTGRVDQSAITGESVPVKKQAGDSVIGATVNKNGFFRFVSSRVGDDTTLSQIIKTVDEASNTKAPIARLADRISLIFVPAVITVSIITFIIWLLLGKDFEFALNCAVSVLVISCPCALGLATPVAITVGTGKAAEYGILVKSAQSLEMLHRTDTVVFDKTGTLTNGTPKLERIFITDKSDNEENIIRLALSAEKGSTHPVAQAIRDYAAKKNIGEAFDADFENIDGKGVKAEINGNTVLCGNRILMKEHSVCISDCVYQDSAASPVYIAVNGILKAVLFIADTLRDTSKKAVSDLKEMGITPVMLTGDNSSAAQSIASKLGIEEVYSEILPVKKQEIISSLKEKGKCVAMAGDGINDAPALISADTGIAVGAGTDIAVEAADIVLIKNSLLDLVTALKLSKKVITNIRTNLFWAFFYNVLAIPLAAGVFYPLTGILLSPMIGAAAMSLSSLCVVSNALRLRFFKDNSNTQEIKKGEITMTKILTIEGMMCVHCKANVIKALSAVENVTNVEVDLEAKTAEVTSEKEIGDEVLIKAVTDAGYEVKSIN